jgi:hypothetical protein
VLNAIVDVFYSQQGKSCIGKKYIKFKVPYKRSSFAFIACPPCYEHHLHARAEVEWMRLLLGTVRGHTSNLEKPLNGRKAQIAALPHTKTVFFISLLRVWSILDT